MAKRKANYAWVKLNTDTMTVNMDGGIVACVREMLNYLPDEKLDDVLRYLPNDIAGIKERRQRIKDAQEALR